MRTRRQVIELVGDIAQCARGGILRRVVTHQVVETDGAVERQRHVVADARRREVHAALIAHCSQQQGRLIDLVTIDEVIIVQVHDGDFGADGIGNHLILIAVDIEITVAALGFQRVAAVIGIQVKLRGAVVVIHVVHLARNNDTHGETAVADRVDIDGQAVEAVLIGELAAFLTIAMGGDGLFGIKQRGDDRTVEIGRQFAVPIQNPAAELHLLACLEHGHVLGDDGLAVDGFHLDMIRGIGQPHGGVAEDKEATVVVRTRDDAVLGQAQHVTDAAGFAVLVGREDVLAQLGA